MTLLEMISRCRSRAFDTAKPYFWSDEQWTDALNEAEEEACIRARLLEDDSIRTVAVEQYAYVKIPPEAFLVRRVLVGGNPIDLSYQDDMASALHRGWESDVGTPLRCYRTGDRLRLHPIPIEAADVLLSAFCTPTTQMLLSKADDDTPKIAGRLHVKLIDWALARFYGVEDADHANANLAGVHEARFVETFGRRPEETEMRRTALRARRSSSGHFF